LFGARNGISGARVFHYVKYQRPAVGIYRGDCWFARDWLSRGGAIGIDVAFNIDALKPSTIGVRVSVGLSGPGGGPVWAAAGGKLRVLLSSCKMGAVLFVLKNIALVCHFRLV
jgi:hypothetical protein